MPTARPVSSTKATGDSPCGRTPGTPGRSSPRAIPTPRCPCASRSWRTNPDRCSPSASVSVTGSGWKEYKFEMQSGNVAASSENHLELTIDRPATLWLQLVSLFPPTYHGRPNGNRIDIMEKLAAMHPAFLRFPGGNYLEGRPHRDPLRLEEDDRSAGRPSDAPDHLELSLHRRHGPAGVPGMVRGPAHAAAAGRLRRLLAGRTGGEAGARPRALRAGRRWTRSSTSPAEPDTKWGAVRARDGHPAPFTLHYVEIGNEDNFDRARTYDGRYAQFYKAIKAKYPNLQVIATMPVKGITPDVVDDHYYKREQGMFEESQPLRQHRPQRPEDLRRRMGHPGRHADSELGRRPGRRRVPDRAGTEQRRGRHGGLRAAVRQRRTRAACSGVPT